MNVNLQVKVRMQRCDFQCIGKVKPGSILLCESGILWVTQTGDCKDYILLPGHTFTVTNRGKVLVEALRDSDFRVGSPGVAVIKSKYGG